MRYRTLGATVILHCVLHSANESTGRPDGAIADFLGECGSGILPVSRPEQPRPFHSMVILCNADRACDKRRDDPVVI